jgi:hypothetical protein
MKRLSVTGKIIQEHATESNIMFAGALVSQEANQNPVDPAFLPWPESATFLMSCLRSRHPP